MKKVIIITGMITAILAGCQQDFLDRTPYDAISSQNAWISDNNATMAINGIYRTLLHDNVFGGFFYFYSNLGPDGYGFFRDESIQRGLSTNRHGLYQGTYTMLYRVIKYSNDAIQNLQDNPNITPDLANRLLGEAKFFRGVSYFYLWQLYGGVIILEEPVEPSETYLSRGSTDEVRNFVISDFVDAAARLPDGYSGADVGRVTKGAALTMLGKTYLYDEQWEKAAEQFGRVVNEFNYDLVEDYSQLFTAENGNSSEIIFSVQCVMEPGLGSSYDMWYGGRSIRTSGQSYSQPSWIAVSSYTDKEGNPIDMTRMPRESDYANEYEYGMDLIEWYQNSFKNVDDRAQANIIIPGFTFLGNQNLTYTVYWPYAAHANDESPAYRIEFSSYALYSWRKMVMTGDDNLQRWDAPIDIPLIRYADVLLMYAEALNELNGSSSHIYDAINGVRNRAGVVDLEAGLSQDEIRRAIWKERLKELAGEGHLFFDVRRWRQAATDDPLFGLNHEILDFRGLPLSYKRVFTEKDYLWPIPQQEIDINNNLQQNPGWE